MLQSLNSFSALFKIKKKKKKTKNDGSAISTAQTGDETDVDTNSTASKTIDDISYSARREIHVEPVDLKNDWVVEFPADTDTDIDLSETINRVENLFLPDESLQSVQLNNSTAKIIDEPKVDAKQKNSKPMKKETKVTRKPNISKSKEKSTQPVMKPVKISKPTSHSKLKAKENPSFTLSMLDDVPEKENIAPNTSLNISAIPKQPEVISPKKTPKTKLSNSDIHLRLYSAASKKRERDLKRVEEEKKKIAESEAALTTFKPQINTKSIKLASGYSKMANVFERTAQVFESERKYREMERIENSKMAECTFKPELSTKTQRIYMQKVKEGDRTLPLFDSLYMDAKERSMLQESVKEFLEEKEKKNKEVLQKSLMSEDDKQQFFNRLYHSSDSKAVKIEAIQAKLTKESCTFTPRIIEKSRRRTGDIATELYSLQKVIEEKRKAKQEEYQRRLLEDYHASKSSSVLVKKLKRNAFEKLFRAISGNKDIVTIEKLRDILTKCKLSEKGCLSQLLHQLNEEDLCTTACLTIHTFKELTKQFSPELLLQEYRECKKEIRILELQYNKDLTFTPMIDENSKKILETAHVTTMDEWAEVKNLKINLLKKRLEAMEMEECSFNPKILSKSKSKSPAKSQHVQIAVEEDEEEK